MKPNDKAALCKLIAAVGIELEKHKQKRTNYCNAADAMLTAASDTQARVK